MYVLEADAEGEDSQRRLPLPGWREEGLRQREGWKERQSKTGYMKNRCRAYPGPSRLSTREENTQDTWPSREGRQRQYGREGELVLLSDSIDGGRSLVN